MLNDLLKIIECLNDKDYLSGKVLASNLDISLRTLRNRITAFNSLAKDYKVKIISKPNLGYKLVFEKETDLISFKNDLNKYSDIPNNNIDRAKYLLVYLLDHRGFVNINKLCDQLAISSSTMKLVIKELNNYLKNYDLAIINKAKVGISLQDDEKKIRELMIAKIDKSWQVDDYLKKIAELVLKHTSKNNIRFSEVGFDKICKYCYCTIKRIEKIVI